MAFAYLKTHKKQRYIVDQGCKSTPRSWAALAIGGNCSQGFYRPNIPRYVYQTLQLSPVRNGTVWLLLTRSAAVTRFPPTMFPIPHVHNRLLNPTNSVILKTQHGLHYSSTREWEGGGSRVKNIHGLPPTWPL